MPGLDSLLRGVIALDQRACHLVGRFAAGKVGDKFGVEGLAVGHPAGRAGGDHRQRAAVLDAVDQLARFLHDGQVGAEIGIKHAGKAQPAQGGGQFAGHVAAHGHAELLAQGRAHSGGRLHNHMLFGVTQQLPHQPCLILFAQGAHRAHRDALPAGDAGGGGKGF